MRRSLLLIFTILFLNAFTGCEDTNVLLITDAAIDAATAITLSDEDVAKLASQAALSSDQKHQVAQQSSKYSKRLEKLVEHHTHRDGKEFDFKVYLTKDVNAFAMADGTIRIYSGLMDLVSDEELLFVIGHEMGHVVYNHSRKQVVMAYASSAIRKGLASQEGELGQIAGSLIGAFAQQLTNAQFSQYEEKQADIYGVRFLEMEGYNSEYAVSALEKLAQLANKHTFLSSHPDPEKRAQLIKEGAYLIGEDQSTLRQIMDIVMSVLAKGVAFVKSLIKMII